MGEALLKVSFGIRLVYIGLMIVVAAVVLAILGFCILGVAVGGAGLGGGGGGPAGGALFAMIAFAVVMGIAVLAGSVVSIVGKLYCFAVPRELGSAKPMIVIAVGMEMTSVFLSGIDLLSKLMVELIPDAILVGMQVLQILAGLTGIILFLLFLKSIANSLRQYMLAGAAQSVLYLWIWAVVCYLLGLVIVVLGTAGGGKAAGVLAGGCLVIIAGIIALVNLVKYANLLRGMAEKTKAYAIKLERGELEPDGEDYLFEHDERSRLPGEEDLGWGEDREGDDRRDDPPRGSHDDDPDGKPWRRQ